MHILVLNSGSSSIKYRVFDMQKTCTLISGEVESIGAANSVSVHRQHHHSGEIEEQRDVSTVPDHVAGLRQIISLLDRDDSAVTIESLAATGHRVVHGGSTFQSPTLIDDEVLEKIREMIPLAPLHNPANLAGIEAMRDLYPQLPQVAVFDTAFFHGLPPHAYRYALPEAIYQQQVRRYGFHGTSHQYVATEAAVYLKQAPQDLRLITLHLGNGASAVAIRAGVCIDTSMGMTPLEGLMMGTRCGDLDPSIVFYLHRTQGMALDEIEEMFNQESGMKGLCGVSDMREVRQQANAGDAKAQLALEMYCYRICKYIGAYHAVLGGLDALIFTGGVGEHDAVIRASVCNQLSVLGIVLDDRRNLQHTGAVTQISADDSKIKVLVITTNEELEIARQTVSIIQSLQE